MYKQLVEQYLRAFPVERDRLEPVLRFLGEVPDDQAISRNQPQHITASGLVVSATRREVLRLHHKRLGALLQPGGHIEPQDGSPLAAARREIAEETRLTSLDHIAFHPDDHVPIDIDVHEIPAAGEELRHIHFDFRFLFVCQDKSQFTLKEDEFDGYEWHAIPELMESNTYHWLKPKIERALSNEFRAKLFFDRVLHLTAPKQQCNAVVVAHLVLQRLFN